MLGYGAGVVVGAAVGNWIESWDKKDAMVERGDAFDFLYKHLKKEARLANPELVNSILDKETAIASVDKNDDGRKWYAMDDLKNFLSEAQKSQEAGLN